MFCNVRDKLYDNVFLIQCFPYLTYLNISSSSYEWLQYRLLFFIQQFLRTSVKTKIPKGFTQTQTIVLNIFNALKGKVPWSSIVLQIYSGITKRNNVIIHRTSIVVNGQVSWLYAHQRKRELVTWKGSWKSEPWRMKSENRFNLRVLTLGTSGYFSRSDLQLAVQSGLKKI